MDERPYLVVDSHNPVFTLQGLVANQKLAINVNFKNIGKGPAIRRITEMHLVNYQAPTGNLTKMQYRTRLRQFTDAWFNKMRRKAEADAEEIDNYSNGHGEDIAPGHTWFATTNDAFVLSPKELANITDDTDGTGALLLFIVTTYKDSFDNAYETDACQMYFGSHSEVWHRCPAYNIIR